MSKHDDGSDSDGDLAYSTYSLAELNDKKRALTEELAHLEKQIYKLEENYLEVCLNASSTTMS